MKPEIYISVAQAADLLGVSRETLYKEIQSGNLTATEHADQKRKHKLVTLSGLSRLYGNIYIRQENARLRKALEEAQKREQDLNDQLTATFENHKTLIKIHAPLTKTLDNLTAVLKNLT